VSDLHEIQYLAGKLLQVLLLPDHSASTHGKKGRRTGLFWQPAKMKYKIMTNLQRTKVLWK
jgi:hypothetical protein